MGITRSDLESFYQFATEHVGNAGADLTFSELYEMWRTEYPAREELAENVAAVKAAIRDMEKGDRGVPFEDHIREMRQKYGVHTDE
jgi:hypothetical protein